MRRIWLVIGVLALSGVVAAQAGKGQASTGTVEKTTVRREQPPLGTVAKQTREARAKAKAAAEVTAAANAKATAGTKATANAKTSDAKASYTKATDAAATTKPVSFTNENLDGRPRPIAPTTYRTAGFTRSNSMVRSTGDGKDEAYWRRRAEPIRRQLQYNTDRLNVAKKRLESLKADDGLDLSVANGRSSPAQAERQRMVSYVQELENQLRRNEQAMKDLEDEGRKAGALPGWFR